MFFGALGNVVEETYGLGQSQTFIVLSIHSPKPLDPQPLP